MISGTRKTSKNNRIASSTREGSYNGKNSPASSVEAIPIRKVVKAGGTNDAKMTPEAKIVLFLTD